MRASIFDDRFFERLLRRLLHVGIDGRVDLQPAFADARPAEAIDQLAADLFLEVLAVAFVALDAVFEMDLGGAGALEAGLIERLVLEHRLEHLRAARDGLVQIDGRRVVRRRLDDAGDHRGFFHRQIHRALVEEAARGRFDAVEAVAEIHLVQIELEDLFLRIGALDKSSEDGFFQLAGVTLIAQRDLFRKAESCELLRDRAGALPDASAAEVRERRAEDAPHVDAGVLEEALVLDREDRANHVGRHPGQRHFDALFLEDREDRLVVAIVEHGRLRHVPQAAQLVQPRNGARHVVGEPRQAAQQHPEHHRARQQARREHLRRQPRDARQAVASGIEPATEAGGHRTERRVDQRNFHGRLPRARLSCRRNCCNPDFSRGNAVAADPGQTRLLII